MSPGSTAREGWRLALGLLTVVRVAPPGRVDAGVARAAMLLAPAAVLPLGGAVALVGVLGSAAGLPPLALGVLAVAALALGSRALHLDGLSDTADGLTASYDPARSLEVMRGGTSGPAGGAAVLLVLALQAAALTPLLATTRGAVLAGALVCLSRCAVWLTCADGVPGARTEGLGVGFVGVVPRLAAAVGWAVAVLVVAALVAWAGGDWWRGALAVLLALGAVLALTRRAVVRFGGVTGDVFGAAIEVALAVLLVVAASG